MAPSLPASMRDALRVPPGPVVLAGHDPSARPLATVANKELHNDVDRMVELQERLYAESTAGDTRSVLLVLQGIDTAGKGGITEHVVGAFGPIGVQYTAFKKPTEEESRHDFLWRVRRRLPPPGVIGVFDRSHYEDVLIVRVHELVPESQWRPRYEQINEFERELTEQGTAIVKCFVNISYDTQRERLLARLDDPDKHWKFSESDIEERAYWDSYQAAFAEMLERTTTEHAPWYVVPGDHKKYRNWAVGQLLHETLEELAPQYPQPALDVPGLRARLAPPN